MFPVERVLRDINPCRSWLTVLEDLKDGNERCAVDVANLLFCWFVRDYGLVLAPEFGKGRFYLWRFQLSTPDGEHAGLIEFGGPHTLNKNGDPTARIEFSGIGCAHIEGRTEARSDHAKRWLELRAKLESLGARLTRVDVAYDDFQGEHTVALARQLWRSGKFDNRGQRPKVRGINDYGSGAGNTFYIGTSASERQLRVYEKGKQLGDLDSPWVRWEAQFSTSSRRDIPLDILRDPAAYLRGAYAILTFVHAYALRMDVTAETVKATVKACLRHIKRQYGPVFDFFRKQLPDEPFLALVVSLSRERPPRWAGDSAEVLHWPAVVAELTKGNGNEQYQGDYRFDGREGKGRHDQAGQTVFHSQAVVLDRHRAQVPAASLHPA